MFLFIFFYIVFILVLIYKQMCHNNLSLGENLLSVYPDISKTFTFWCLAPKLRSIFLNIINDINIGDISIKRLQVRLYLGEKKLLHHSNMCKLWKFPTENVLLNITFFKTSKKKGEEKYDYCFNIKAKTSNVVYLQLTTIIINRPFLLKYHKYQVIINEKKNESMQLI